MTVYMAKHGEYYDPEALVLGLYSTREKAQAALDAQKQADIEYFAEEDNDNVVDEICWYSIEEVEVQ